MRIDKLERKLEFTKARGAKIKQELAQKKQELAQKKQELAQKKQVLAQKNGLIQNIRQSKSWRLTLPLRKLGALWRRLFGKGPS